MSIIKKLKFIFLLSLCSNVFAKKNNSSFSGELGVGHLFSSKKHHHQSKVKSFPHLNLNYKNWNFTLGSLAYTFNYYGVIFFTPGLEHDSNQITQKSIDNALVFLNTRAYFTKDFFLELILKQDLLAEHKGSIYNFFSDYSVSLSTDYLLNINAGVIIETKKYNKFYYNKSINQDIVNFSNRVNISMNLPKSSQLNIFSEQLYVDRAIKNKLLLKSRLITKTGVLVTWHF